MTVLHYRVLERLAKGPWSEVYKARDTRFGRLVALKFLSPSLLADAPARARFVREARTLCDLHHAGICAIYESGEAGGRPYLAMEFLEGEPLSERLRGGPLPLADCVEIARQAAAALEAAHARGIVHRDIKPGNIFLGRGLRVKLLDFGLSRSVAPLAPPESATATMDLRTLPGATIGTLAYMPPEQVCGEPVDGRADIFSLGVVIYEMATGQLPLSGLPLPPLLAPIVAKAIAKQPSQRYASAAELGSALQTLKAPQPPPPASRFCKIR